MTGRSATARTAVTGGTGLAELFEAQARADPQAPAYVCGDAVVSFGELRSRVHGLAHRLRALGVGPDVPVGLYLPRSIDSAVGLLAILAAGGAYLPLDPGYPIGQVEHMLGDAQARAVVTSPELSGSLPGSAPAVFVDGPAASFAPVATAPRHLSHIMYTSGSTGAPKGVLVPQRQLLNRFSWMWRSYPFASDDVLCQRSGVGFSVSMWEFLGGPLRGIPTVLVPPSADRDPVELLDTLHRHRVTRVTVVPSLLRVLLSVGRWPLLPHVRQWTVCGEPLTRELYDRLLLATPAAQVCVDYGTTETNGFLWNDTGRSPSPRPTVPVGRPAAGMSVTLLDGSGQPVPPGEPGYVHVRGPGLARGYLNRPDLTADRFGPAGFRPGDLARLLPDGGYEFVGRTDNQVKIHGVRVELEGVEAHLREHPSVAHAVAAAPDGILVAHVVAAPGADRDPAALRRFLATRLPPAAVPTRYVYTEAIPVLPTGKVDRRRLATPAVAATTPAATATTPAATATTPAGGPVQAQVHRRLAEAWAAVLAVPSVGLHDDFFDLGGDSLLAMQLVARCLAVGLRLTPDQLAERPTIARLAPVVQPCDGAAGLGPLPPGPVPLSPGQRKTLAHGWPEPHHWNTATLRRIAPGADPATLAAASRGIARHHDALRLRFARSGDGWRQWLADDVELFTHVRIDDVETSCRAAQPTLDLAAGPVARVVYLDRGPDRSGRVLIIVNHLVADAAAAHLVREDFERLYVDLLAGGPGSLPAKTATIREWAESLRADRAELPYWSSLPWRQVRPLPVDRPRATHRSMAPGRTELFDAGEVRALARRTEVRVDELLLTVVARALAAWNGCPSQGIDWIRHGRTPVAPGIDVSRTVGFFANYVPAVVDVDPGTDLATAARHVAVQLRRMPRDGIGYDLLGLDLPAREVCVNFVGQYRDSTAPWGPFGPAHESPGPVRSPQNRFSTEHRLYFFARVDGDRLAFQYDYSPDVYHAATVDGVFRAAVADLRGGNDAQR